MARHCDHITETFCAATKIAGSRTVGVVVQKMIKESFLISKRGLAFIFLAHKFNCS